MFPNPDLYQWYLQYSDTNLGRVGLGLVIFAVAYLFFKILQTTLVLKLEKLSTKTNSTIDDTLIRILKSINSLYYLYLSFYLATFVFEWPDRIMAGLFGVLIIWSVFQAIKAANIVIDYAADKYTKDNISDDTSTAVSALKIAAKIFLWTVAILMILSNMGVNISSLVAGLGITGVAVALAVQNILGDLLSSFSLYFDKPFKVGDVILVNGQIGEVKKIGVKTTRVKALQGEEIVFPNQTLTSNTIQNFKKLRKRRIVFSFGVTYETKSSKLRQIPQMVKEIIESVDDTEFDRANFASFGESALNYEIVYLIETGDYNRYMDIQEEINLGIVEAFEKAKIDMAYPTQTVYLKKD